MNVPAPASGRNTVDIFNLVGERVRRLAEWNAGAEESFCTSWNGLTDRGDYAGNGVYFVLLRGPAGVTMSKLIVLK